MRKRIRKGKGKDLPYNPWNHDAEIGDRMVCSLSGKIYLLYESHGWAKAARGELSMREIKPPRPDAYAILVDGVAYWEWDDK